MARQRQPTNQKPKYEDVVGILKDNLEDFETFYYAALMKTGNHGQNGMQDGLYASLWGLRKKVGLEGILRSLETQGLQSIQGGNGLNSNYSLSDVISKNAKVFLQSAGKLKIQDLVPYITDRLNADIAEEVDYKDKTIEYLTREGASEKSKFYGVYLREQLENAVMAKVTPLACDERAKRTTEMYQREVQNSQPRN